jgi:predicted  nucleic acid-binding Zn-ribbon protein
VDGQLKTLIDLQTFDTRIAGLEGEAAKLPKEIEAVPVPLDELRRDLGATTPRYVTDVCTALGLQLALARFKGGA